MSGYSTAAIDEFLEWMQERTKIWELSLQSLPEPDSSLFGSGTLSPERLSSDRLTPILSPDRTSSVSIGKFGMSADEVRWAAAAPFYPKPCSSFGPPPGAVPPVPSNSPPLISAHVQGTTLVFCPPVGCYQAFLPYGSYPRPQSAPAIFR